MPKKVKMGPLHLGLGEHDFTKARAEEKRLQILSSMKKHLLT
jgi:hypothetical protein